MVLTGFFFEGLGGGAKHKYQSVIKKMYAIKIRCCFSFEELIYNSCDMFRDDYNIFLKFRKEQRLSFFPLLTTLVCYKILIRSEIVQI